MLNDPMDEDELDDEVRLEEERICLLRDLATTPIAWGIAEDIKLMNHQIEGVSWMAGKEDLGHGGGILGKQIL